MGAETNYCYTHEDTVQRSANHSSNSRTIHFIQSINRCCPIKVLFTVRFQGKKKQIWTLKIVFPFTFSHGLVVLLNWKLFKRVKTLCKLKVRFIASDQPISSNSDHLLVFLLRKRKINRINPTVVYCVKKKKDGEGEEGEEEEKLNCFNCFLSK